MAKTTTTQTTTYAPWINNFAQGNLAYADALTSGVMNRYAGGPYGTGSVPNYGYVPPNAYTPNYAPYTENPFTPGFGGNFGASFAPPPSYAVPAPPPQPGQPGSWGAMPQSFVANFSDDTKNAHAMTRNYAADPTPANMRGIAGDMGGYRSTVARGLTDNDARTKAINDAIAGLGRMANTTPPQFAPYAALHGYEIAAPSIAATTVGDVNNITASQGAAHMNTYLNPYLQQVVDTSLRDFDVGVDRQANQARARRDAASAFGDRAAIADAVYAADSNRGRGTLSSGLRSDAFNTAATFGMQDSNRFLEADRTNQSVALQRAMENARLQQAAAIANANWADEASRFNTGIRNDFLLTNDTRQRNLETQNFNAGLGTTQANADILAAQAALAQQQQLHQLKLAQGLNGLAIDQTGILTTADEAERQRIAALAGVGADFDARNQAILNEPLDLLRMRADLLNQTPMPTTTTETVKKKKGLIGSLTSGLGLVNQIF